MLDHKGSILSDESLQEIGLYDNSVCGFWAHSLAAMFWTNLVPG